MPQSFSIIVAVDADSGIGKSGGLPWHLSADLKHFKAVTTKVSRPDQQNAVIMGRKTWESLPENYRPLPNRFNLVLTRNKNFSPGPKAVACENLDAALEFLKENGPKHKINQIFVIGGGQIFSEAILHPACQKIYLTQILNRFNCDTFFPALPRHFRETHRSIPHIEGSLSYSFAEYAKTA